MSVPTRVMKAGSLAKAIFHAEVPEKYIRKIPAQSLYLAVKENGLLGSADLIEIASIEQVRLLIDFDCWHGDAFSEEQFWEWLSLTDETDGLDLLKKILRCTDLKLVALLISRYVQVEVFEDQTEQPPGPHFYTPDNGFTWLNVNIEDSTKHFLLSRLLAAIFETSRELFYQLISIPGTSTPSVLEEDSYQDRNRRLASEGVPEAEYAASLQTPISLPEFQSLLSPAYEKKPIENIPIIEPMISEGAGDILDRLLQEVARKGMEAQDQGLAELTLLINAAVVHWRVEYSEQEEVLFTIQRVRGLLCLGLELLAQEDKIPAIEAYQQVGLTAIYQLGLWKLLQLQYRAKKISREEIERSVHDSELFSLIAGMRERIPIMPKWFQSDEEFQESSPLDDRDSSEESQEGDLSESESTRHTYTSPSSLRGGYRAITSLQEIEAIEEVLERRLQQSVQ